MCIDKICHEISCDSEQETQKNRAVNERHVGSREASKHKNTGNLNDSLIRDILNV